MTPIFDPLHPADHRLDPGQPVFLSSKAEQRVWPPSSGRSWLSSLLSSRSWASPISVTRRGSSRPSIRCTASSFVQPRLSRLRGPGLRLPCGDRRRGPLRRHGSFWSAADPGRLALLRPPSLMLNYLGQGALVLANPKAVRESLLPAGSVLGAAAARHPLDGGHGDREPSRYHGRLSRWPVRPSSSGFCRA